MRHSLVLLLAVLTLSSFAMAAKLKVVSDFYKESETLLTSAQKSPASKKEKFKQLENSFKSTLDQYEKENPKGGNKSEEEISLLFYTLEPVFKLLKEKKIDLTECPKARQEVKTGDSMGRPEGSLASKQASEAYKWLDVLCPEAIEEVETSPTK